MFIDVHIVTYKFLCVGEKVYNITTCTGFCKMLVQPKEKKKGKVLKNEKCTKKKKVKEFKTFYYKKWVSIREIEVLYIGEFLGLR